MEQMEQLWLVFSLLSLITGFGLLVAVLLLKRFAPVQLPPVVPLLAALLVMGVASLTGIYLELRAVPTGVMAHRILNAAAWGGLSWAALRLLRSRRLGGRRVHRRAARGQDGAVEQSRVRRLSSTLEHGLSGKRPFPRWIPWGVAGLVTAAAYLAAHPSPQAVLAPYPQVRTAIILAIQALVALLAILVALTCLRCAGNTSSRPWRIFFRGLGTALLLLVPAHLLDFAVSLAVRAGGGSMQDGLVFAFGYALANVVLISTLVRSLRLSGDAEDAPVVPHAMAAALGITRREREVIEKLLEGKRDREIAEELFISPRTVDTHLRTVYRKCGVRSRLELSRLVSSYGELRNAP